MRPMTISAVLLGVAHVTLAVAVAAPVPPLAGSVSGASDGADGGAGVTLARAGASPFLAVPETRQSALLPVGEGGEGGRGRWRRGGYGPGGYYGYGWGPPPRYYYAPPPPPRAWRPPPVYYAPPPVYYVPPPPVYYAPSPGVSLNFRF